MSNSPIKYDSEEVFIPDKFNIDLKKIKFTRFIDLLKDIAPELDLITTTLENPNRWITLSQNNLQRVIEFTDTPRRRLRYGIFI